jgi:hypothetical protein
LEFFPFNHVMGGIKDVKFPVIFSRDVKIMGV